MTVTSELKTVLDAFDDPRLIRWSAPEEQRTPETIYEILDTHQTKEALSLLLAVGIGFHASNRHLSATE